MPHYSKTEFTLPKTRVWEAYSSMGNLCSMLWGDHAREIGKRRA